MIHFLSLFVTAALAATSQMSYEGVLTDVAGTAVSTPTAMSVRITDGASCVVHTQSFGSVIPDSSGFFSLQISGLTKAMFELPGTCAGSTARYLELTVDGEVFPLIEMDSTPYSMVAGTAQEATSLTGAMGASSSGQVLTWNGSSWAAQTPSAGTETDPTVPAWAKSPALAVADIPVMDASKIASGVLPVVRGGTGSSTLPTCTAAEFLRFDGSNWACATPSTAAETDPTISLWAKNAPAARLATTGNILDLNSSGVTAGTYTSVTVDTYGRVTAGTSPTTLAGYGVIDAIQNGGGLPSISTGTLVSRPTFGTAGRLYVASDKNLLYQDTGSSWVGITAPNLITKESGTYLTSVGYLSAVALASGANNTSIGYSALSGITNGSNNLAIGATAGQNVTSGSGNIFIGRGAGPTSSMTVSNKLYISNSSNDFPLIAGDFSLSTVTINGSLNLASAGAYLNYKPNNVSCANADVLGWDGTNQRWICQAPSGGSGDISDVIAGPGLSGGASSGSATLSLQTCSNGQVLQSTGSSWNCVTPAAAPSPNTILHNGNSFGGTMTIGTNDNSPMAFEINGSEVARVTTSGRLGLNTAGPNADLEVRGPSSTPGTIATDELYFGSWATATRLTASSIGAMNLSLPSSVPSTNPGIMTLTSSGQMNWTSCTAGQILRFNGSTWSCDIISKSANQLVATVFNCDNFGNCYRPSDFDYPSTNNIALIKFTGVVSNTNNVQIDGNFLYNEDTNAQIQLQDLTNNQVYFMKYDPTVPRWLVENHNNGNNNSDKGQTIASTEFMQSFGTTLNTISSAVLEAQNGLYFSRSSSPSSGYRDLYSFPGPDGTIDGALGVIVLEVNGTSGDYAQLSFCDSNSSSHNRYRPSPGTITTVETEIVGTSAGSTSDIFVGFANPQMAVPISGVYNVGVLINNNSSGFISNSTGWFCNNAAGCTSAGVGGTLPGGNRYKVKVEYRGTQEMKVFYNDSDEVHSYTYGSTNNPSSASTICPMIRLITNGSSSKIFLDSLKVTKRYQQGLP